MLGTTNALQTDRNLALDLVRVTEAASLAASRWIGRGDKNAADGAAVSATLIPVKYRDPSALPRRQR